MRTVPSADPLKRSVCEKARCVITDTVHICLISVPVELLINKSSGSSVEATILGELVALLQKAVTLESGLQTRYYTHEINSLLDPANNIPVVPFVDAAFTP